MACAAHPAAPSRAWALPLIVLLAGAEVGAGLHEELLLRPLPDGRTLAVFTFQQSARLQQHLNGFPRAPAQLLDSTAASSLSLAFTHGRWHTHRWGEAPFAEKTAGVELQASLHGLTPAAPDAAVWGNISHSLSGLFCASLNLLSQPGRAVQLPGSCGGHAAAGDSGREGARCLVGQLPDERVCLENMTPWLKMLPCRDTLGIASLLRRAVVYGADYHSMQVALSRDLPSGDAYGVPRYVLVQTLALVLRTPTPAAPRPAAVDLQELFGVPVRRLCPLAKHSRILLDVPLPAISAPLQERFRAQDDGRCDACAKAVALLASAPGAELLLLRTGDGKLAHVLLTWPLQAAMQAAGAAHDEDLRPFQQLQSRASSAPWPPRMPPLLVRQHSSGAGDEGGVLVLQMERSAAGQRSAAALAVCARQQAPWFLQLWLHTLQLHIDGRPLPQRRLLALRLLPGESRAAPHLLEACFQLPAAARQATLSVAFTKGFLTVFEHPPDAARGFDVPAATVTYAAASPQRSGVQPGLLCRAEDAAGEDPQPANRGPDHYRCAAVTAPSAAGEAPYDAAPKDGSAFASTSAIRLATMLDPSAPREAPAHGLLVSLAAPDFSMPYNVNCLSCTVLALFFGSLLNALMERPRQSALAAASKRATTRKRLLLLGLALLFAALAVALDSGLRESLHQLLAPFLP